MESKLQNFITSIKLEINNSEDSEEGRDDSFIEENVDLPHDDIEFDEQDIIFEWKTSHEKIYHPDNKFPYFGPKKFIRFN